MVKPLSRALQLCVVGFAVLGFTRVRLGDRTGLGHLRESIDHPTWKATWSRVDEVVELLSAPTGPEAGGVPSGSSASAEPADPLEERPPGPPAGQPSAALPAQLTSGK